MPSARKTNTLVAPAKGRDYVLELLLSLLLHSNSTFTNSSPPTHLPFRIFPLIPTTLSVIATASSTPAASDNTYLSSRTA